MPQLAQATQDPNHPANPQHPKVSVVLEVYIYICPSVDANGMRTAWSLGQEARREARKRRHLRRRSDGRLGLGQLDYLSNFVYFK